MKIIITIILFITILTANANAGLPIPFKVYAGGGVTIPSTMPILEESWKTGFHLNGGLGISMAPKFQMILKTELHKFALDGEKANFPSAIEPPDFYAFLIGLEGRLSFGNPITKIKPFLLLGGGVAITSYSVFDAAAFDGTGTTAPTLTDANKFYYNFGVGADLKTISLITIFAQLQLMQIMTENETTQFVPFSIGIKF